MNSKDGGQVVAPVAGLTDRLLAGALRQAVDDYAADLKLTSLADSTQREYVSRVTEFVDWLTSDGWQHPAWRHHGERE